MKDRTITIESEAHLVSLFKSSVLEHNALVEKHRGDPSRAEWASTKSVWTIYPETAGWDLLLVDQHGVQIGIEAKMTLNVKVLSQALPHYYASDRGPDYRAVLVARAGLQLGLQHLASHLGITVIRLDAELGWRQGAPVHISTQPNGLPDEMTPYDFDIRNWHPWHPLEREVLPDYIPDVEGGRPSPVTLTDWKIRAIKLTILLDRRGYVTRRDMDFLKISPTMWTKPFYGFLTQGDVRGQWVRCERTRDFRKQHPENYAQIEADWENWKPADDA